MPTPTLRFAAGTLLLNGSVSQGRAAELLGTPTPAWDGRVSGWRADALAYPDVRDRLRWSVPPVADTVPAWRHVRWPNVRLPELRAEQHKAVEGWTSAGRGCVIMPTGTGKTEVALAIMAQTAASTLIVAPVRDLMYQWHRRILRGLGYDAGVIGDSTYRVKPVAVTTYDSACIHMQQLGNRFELIVFDECHHLPGDVRRDAARMSAAPLRLGLTATPERSDGRDADLDWLIGPRVYELSLSAVRGRTLADYDVVRLPVFLTDAEQARYDRLSSDVRQYVAERRQDDPQFTWQELCADTGRTPEARRILRTYYAKKSIEDRAEEKLRVLEDLFRLHAGEPFLIFAGSNAMARDVSKRFLIPCLLSHCGKRERLEVLEGLETGRYPALVANRVLDEGVDLPAVKVAAVIGGTASTRQSRQRLGRVLRKSGNQRAVLYEIVCAGTNEEQRVAAAPEDGGVCGNAASAGLNRPLPGRSAVPHNRGMASDSPRRRLCWLGPALIAVMAGAAVVAAIDPAGSYPAAPQGPGLTVDERFNVEEGVRLAVGLHAVAAGEIRLTELFNDDNPPAVADLIGNHLADHPPLGRLWIGLFHDAAKNAVPPHEPHSPFVVACARTAPAAAFALTVFLVGWTVARWYGTAAGLIAAAALVLMPRVFGHAHLASLETFIGLTYTAAVLSVANSWVRESRRPPGLAAAGVAGVVFGLALLTKIQAVFLPAAVAGWALWHWRRRAILPLAVWTAVGLLVLFVGWPWLWLDPPGHFAEYLGRTGERLRLNVWYFGTQYADRAVPWHYPLVMFLATVPAGLHALAACGLASRAGRSPEATARERLLLAAIAVPLAAFAWPGIAVYDGARLFLVVFPLWAIFIGRGGAVALDWLQRRFRAGVARVGVTAFVLLQGVGLVLVHPACLSYYNVLVGGLPGARAIGLELSYWGDSVTRDLLEATAAHVPAGSTIDFTPVLEPHQLDFLIDQSPILRERRLRLRAFEDRFLETGETKYLLYFHRYADIAPDFRDGPARGRLLAEVRRQGVQLAALYAFDRP